jgi:hypothetical protein
LRQDELVQEVSVLPAAVADDNLDVARVGEDRELVLGADAAAAIARAPGAVRAVAAQGRGARRVRGDRGRAADGERGGALGADVAPDLGVWVGNHAQGERGRFAKPGRKESLFSPYAVVVQVVAMRVEVVRAWCRKRKSAWEIAEWPSRPQTRGWRLSHLSARRGASKAGGCWDVPVRLKPG